MQHWAVGLIVAAMFLSNLGFGCAEESSSFQPEEQQMLVLRNGEVLQGRVTRQDDFYILELPNGYVRLKQSEVELICKNLEEGYQKKRAATQVGNVHHHLQLAQWCMRQRLWGQAAAELADAAKADPHNPLIAALRQRLEMAMSPPPLEEKHPIVTGPSNEELDRMIRTLPPRAVEKFTQYIQPILLNQCTSSGCHGPLEKQGLRLMRVGANKSPGRRATQRNLYNVLQYVNCNNPLASPLLTIPVAPHGNAQHAIFGQQQAEQYRRLREWVLQVSGRTPPAPADLPSESAPENREIAQAAAPFEQPPEAFASQKQNDTPAETAAVPDQAVHAAGLPETEAQTAARQHDQQH